MGNNIKEKNLIYSLRDYRNLPYSDYRTINYGGNNTYLNSIAINNTFN